MHSLSNIGSRTTPIASSKIDLRSTPHEAASKIKGPVRVLRENSALRFKFYVNPLKRTPYFTQPI